jgi:ribose transport system ATP-binding protein
MLGRRVDVVFPDATAAPAPDDVVCEVLGLSSPPRLRDVSLTIRRGEILGIGGLQGQGQLALFQALFGARPASGEIRVEGRRVRIRRPPDAIAAGLALIPEDRAVEGLCLTLGIRENITLGSLPAVSTAGLVNPAKERGLIRGALAELNVAMRNVRQEVAALSGGNQQKVLLGRVLAQQPSLLLMYDATRGVDVGTKAEIYRLMRAQCAQGTSILFYSTDVMELVHMAHRVLVLHDGRIRAELEADAISESRIVAESVGGGVREAVG